MKIVIEHCLLTRETYTNEWYKEKKKSCLKIYSRDFDNFFENLKRLLRNIYIRLNIPILCEVELSGEGKHVDIYVAGRLLTEEQLSQRIRHGNFIRVEFDLYFSNTTFSLSNRILVNKSYWKKIPLKREGKKKYLGNLTIYSLNNPAYQLKSTLIVKDINFTNSLPNIFAFLKIFERELTADFNKIIKLGERKFVEI